MIWKLIKYGNKIEYKIWTNNVGIHAEISHGIFNTSRGNFRDLKNGVSSERDRNLLNLLSSQIHGRVKNICSK